MPGKRFNPRLPSGFRPYVSLGEIAETMTATKLASRRGMSLGFVGQSGMAIGATPVYEPPVDWWAIKTEVGAGEYTVHRQIWDTSSGGVFTDSPNDDDLTAWHINLHRGLPLGGLASGRFVPLLDGTMAVLFGAVVSPGSASGAELIAERWLYVTQNGGAIVFAMGDWRGRRFRVYYSALVDNTAQADWADTRDWGSVWSLNMLTGLVGVSIPADVPIAILDSNTASILRLWVDSTDGHLYVTVTDYVQEYHMRIAIFAGPRRSVLDADVPDIEF